MNENVVKFLRHPATLSTITGVTCFGLGYLLGRRNKIIAHTIPVQEEWDTSIAEEPDVVVIIPREEMTSREIIDEGNRLAEEREAQEAVEVLINGAQFAGESEEWDLEKEIASRDDREPYILHRDEFYSDEMDFSQTTLTYYAGDDILSDQEDKPVYNHVNTVGPLRFGHGSDDPNVFYVRNTRLKAEFEVIFDTGLYSEIVLGLDIEQNDRAQDLKHSHTVHKFRPE